MSVYYNEIDPYCAQWLQNLMDAGHIPCGVIDTRSIEDVLPDELAGYVQCHFFAGIGGWPLALALAGWPRDRPVWTGSCPCQPFSAAGKGAGFADQRHLWPAWFHLISQCRPATVFGEQVASKDADAWIDLVHADLEGMGYAFGCVPFPAAGVGSPHIRDRNYWVADADDGCERLVGTSSSKMAQRGEDIAPFGPRWRSETGGVADANGRNASAERQQRGGEQRQQPQDGGACGVAKPHGECAGVNPETIQARESESCGHSEPIGLHLPEGMRLRMSRTGDWSGAGQHGMPIAQPHSEAIAGLPLAQRAGPTNGFWRDADWLRCRDGKWRPVEPGTFPLAHGLSGRVGRLRAYGNAIVPQAAQAFIRAFLDVEDAQSVA